MTTVHGGNYAIQAGCTSYTTTPGLVLGHNEGNCETAMATLSKKKT